MLIVIVILGVPSGLWSPPGDGVILGPFSFDSSLQEGEQVLNNNSPNGDLPERLELSFNLFVSITKPSEKIILVQTSKEKASGLELVVNADQKLELWGNVREGYSRKRVLWATTNLIPLDKEFKVRLLIDQGRNIFDFRVDDREFGFVGSSNGIPSSLTQFQLEIDQVRLGGANMSNRIRIESFTMHFSSITNTANLDLVRYLLIVGIVFVLIPFSSEFLRKTTELRIFRFWRENFGFIGSLVCLASLVFSQMLVNRLETRKTELSLGQGNYEFLDSKEQTRSFEWSVDFRLTTNAFEKSEPVISRGLNESSGISLWVDQYRTPFLVLESDPIGAEKIQVVRLGEPIDGPRNLRLNTKFSHGKVVSLDVEFENRPVELLSVRDSTPIDLSKLRPLPFSAKDSSEKSQVKSESVLIVESIRTLWTVLAQLAVVLAGFLVIPVIRRIRRRREPQSMTIE